jgi:hypothetical protein
MISEQLLDLGLGHEPVLEFMAGGKAAMLGAMGSGSRKHPLDFLGSEFGTGVSALRGAMVISVNAGTSPRMDNSTR